MDNQRDEQDVFNQSWAKMERLLHQEGYREGSSAGRDLTFQQGFDSGYNAGFNAGYSLGLHNGVLKYLNSEASTLDPSLKGKLGTIESVNNPNRGLCVICSNGSEDIPDEESEIPIRKLSIIENKQKELLQEKEKLLCSKNEYLSVLKKTNLYQLFNS